MKNLNENELIEIVFRGDKLTDKAFSELYNRNSKAVYSLCQCMMKDKIMAEEIFQETFIRFYKSCKSGTEINNVKAFLITIARNLIKNSFRNKSNIETYLTNEIDWIDDSYKYEDSELLEMVMASLDLMDEKYKEAFIYREFYNLSFDEIADITGISLQGVKSRLLRSKLKLAEILQPYIKENY